MRTRKLGCRFVSGRQKWAFFLTSPEVKSVGTAICALMVRSRWTRVRSRVRVVELVEFFFSNPKDLGPSNGRSWTCIAGVGRVLKIASFEGPMILREYCKFLVCKTRRVPRWAGDQYQRISMLICDVLQIFSDPSTCDCSRSWLFKKGLGARFTYSRFLTKPWSVIRAPIISNGKKGTWLFRGFVGMKNYPVL